MAQFAQGFTHYCNGRYRFPTGGVKGPGLVTIEDPQYNAPQAAPYPDAVLVSFQPQKAHPEYYWVGEADIRDAYPDDFSLGDIIGDNNLSLFSYEITNIKPPAKVGSLTDPPIEAEALDENGIRVGMIFHFEPYEAVLQDPCSEPTVDLLRPLEEPRNNDGLKKCFWCRGRLERRVAFHLDHYDYCPKCEK